MVAVTICSDCGAQENKICHSFQFFLFYLPWRDGARCHDLSFLMLRFKPAFSLSLSPSSRGSLVPPLFLPYTPHSMGFPFGSKGRVCPQVQETRVRSLGREDSPEKEMATHSSILAWRIPWTEEPDTLQSRGSQRVRHNWATSLSMSAGWPAHSGNIDK